MFGSSGKSISTSFALVDNLAGVDCLPGELTTLPFDSINYMSPNFSLSADNTRIHFGPGIYIVTVDAYPASAPLTSGELSVFATFESNPSRVVSVGQGSAALAAASGAGAFAFDFIATPNTISAVSLACSQTDSVTRSIASDLLIIQLSSTVPLLS